MKTIKTIASYRAALALSAVYFLAMMDRQVIAVMFDPIKAEFGLTDFQVAMVGSTAFAVFYGLAGIPLGRMADKTNRVVLLTVTMAIWSVATIATGLATGFVFLFLARILVGVGEASCLPASHSIISDVYQPEKRGTALGIFIAGGTFGTTFAYLFGGWMVQLYDWRTAMIIVGLPGIVAVLALGFFMREPPRKKLPADKSPTEPLLATLGAILKNPSYVLSVIGHVAAMGYLFVAVTWLPSYINRSFDMPFGQLGNFLFASSLFGSCAGAVVSGAVADYLYKRNVRWLAILPALLLILTGPFAFVAFLAEDLVVLFLGVVVIKAFLVGSQVSSFSVVHYVVPSNMRGVAIATKVVLTSIVGVGVFPLIVGAVSDVLAAAYGDASLRYGLVLFTVLCPLGALAYVFILKFLPTRSIDETEADSHVPA